MNELRDIDSSLVLRNSNDILRAISQGKKCPYLEFFWSVFSVFELNTGDTEYLSVFSPNAGKYGPEKLRIRTLFTQCIVWGQKIQSLYDQENANRNYQIY